MFRGVGRTAVPSFISIASNALRVAGVYLLSHTAFRLSGVFWAISMGALLRGSWTSVAYLIASKKFPKEIAEGGAI